ncbi:unnamed protein product, partial [Closterium sp. NIES-54]
TQVLIEVLRLGVLHPGVLRLGVISLCVRSLGVLSLRVLGLRGPGIGVLSLGVLSLRVRSLGGAESEGAESGGAEPRGTASSRGPAASGAGDSAAGDTGAGVVGATRLGGAGFTAGAGGTRGAGAAGHEGACTRGIGDAGPGRVGGTGAGRAGAGDPAVPGGAGAGGARAGGTGAGCAGAGGAGAGDTGAVDPRAGGAGAGGAVSGSTGARGNSESASPPSVGGECALGMDVLEDRQENFELHSLDFSTAFLQGSLHEEIRLRRPPGFTGSFPAGTQWSLRRPVYGLRQAPREWYDTERTTLAALGFTLSTADPSLFLRTDTSLPPFYILVYVDDLIFPTADTEALALVESKLQKRHTCLDLDESIEPSGPYPEHVVCLMYLITSTRPDLAYPLSILARYVVPGRHRPENWEAAKRVLRYLCSTSGIGLVLGGRGPVVLTGHVDAS